MEKLGIVQAFFCFHTSLSQFKATNNFFFKDSLRKYQTVVNFYFCRFFIYFMCYFMHFIDFLCLLSIHLKNISTFGMSNETNIEFILIIIHQTSQIMEKLLRKPDQKYLLLFMLLVSLLSNSQNLYDSSATLIWDAAANSSYNFNVTKIGRDDADNLNLKQITSSSYPNLSIGIGDVFTSNAANTNTFNSDRSFLIWGDNNGDMNDSDSDLALTFGGTTGVTTHTDIPHKIWKSVESGADVQSTKLVIPTSSLSGLPILTGNDAYVLVVASDESFTTNVETISLTTKGINQEVMYDFDGVQYFTFGVAHETVLSRSLTFNGVDNVMKIGNVNNLSNNFSMMVWIRPTGQNNTASDRTIISKYNGTTGFRMYLTTDNKIHASFDATHLVSNTVLPNDEWHNICIIYNGTNIKLYIDGVTDASVDSTYPSSNANTCSIGGEYRSKADIRNFFKGDIDEFRYWNKSITITQIRFMMNQEIAQNSTTTKGVTIPGNISKNELNTMNWTNLVAYYNMNSFIGTTINDNSSYHNRGNVFSSSKVTVDSQTAPLPYKTAAHGLWTDRTSWENGNIQALPCGASIVSPSTQISWNIIETNHNISTTANKSILGLIVKNNTLTANNDIKLQVSHYLKLDGKIDLVGRAQLIQLTNSDLDTTSAGSLERDQQGQSNRFNYNYWSSPVSSINNTANNNGYTVADVMKDGTDPNNIHDIAWTSDSDAVASSPITLSDYWIFKFQNVSNNAANWSQVGPYGTLLAGQGYTLKGSNSGTPTQNYTFVGKPNNGTIASPISANNLNLCGNPYPSAINASTFITDNINSINGTLYFWEHYSTNDSHITQLYQGGYATRTLVGGTPPVSPSGVSGLGTSAKTPGKCIPVGQGFFVTGSATGGNIVFKNSQRIFIKENSTKSNTLFKANSSPAAIGNDENDNSEDEIESDTYVRVRLGFNSYDNHHRQILIGFMDDLATAAYDDGYDAKSIEIQNDDMYFIKNEYKLNIQGEGYFNINNTYPLGVTVSSPGDVSFVVDELENFPDNQDIYIYDTVNQTYASIKNEPFTINLPFGNHDNRFELRFYNPTALGVTQNNLASGIIVTHSIANNMLTIKNETTNAMVKSVAVFNLLGQNIMKTLVKEETQSEINIPVTIINTGAYIVKVATDKGEITKKILIH
jgi:hypothetical protein